MKNIYFQRHFSWNILITREQYLSIVLVQFCNSRENKIIPAIVFGNMKNQNHKFDADA